jgi:hypothetical protein
MKDVWAIVVPWVTNEEIEQFLDAWLIQGNEPWLVLQRDELHEGCGTTKNKGVARAVNQFEAEIVIVLDGDCYPTEGGAQTLPELAEAHIRALEPQPVLMYEEVTSPPSRGTPYADREIMMEVAASMGFWMHNGDHCAVRQLATKNAPMSFVRKAIHGRYFSLCGMNLAFRPKRWDPWCRFIDVPRFDDIWMGWLWQREAYRLGCCFNLAGPLVRHARQSNVWKNLKDEVRFLETNECLWREIASDPSDDYIELRGLLPC